MRASEIITDDILSRERRRAHDIVGSRNRDKRYQFWTPEQRLKYDQLDKFVPRAIDKLRDGPVEEDVEEPIKVLFGILKSGDRRGLINFLRAHPELKDEPAYRTAEKILDTWEKIGADSGKHKSSPQFTFETSYKVLSNPVAIGLSYVDLKTITGNAKTINVYESALRKKFNLSKQYNILESWGYYVRHQLQNRQLTESTEQNTQEQLLTKFNRATQVSLMDARPGDQVAIVHLKTLAIPGHNTVARLEGFLAPRRIESVDQKIFNNRRYQQIVFEDGTAFPSRGISVFKLEQTLNMTRLFEDYDSAYSAYSTFQLTRPDERDDSTLSFDDSVNTDPPKENDARVEVDEESLDNTLNMTAFEDSLDTKYTICAPGSRQPTMIFHTREEAQENLKRAPKGSTIERVVPKKKTSSEMMGEEWEVKEAAQSMRQAARNPQGAKFGGYYGATQKGPPRPGQGFGAAE